MLKYFLKAVAELPADQKFAAAENSTAAPVRLSAETPASARDFRAAAFRLRLTKKIHRPLPPLLHGPFSVCIQIERGINTRWQIPVSSAIGFRVSVNFTPVYREFFHWARTRREPTVGQARDALESVFATVCGDPHWNARLLNGMG